ncbi:MAG: Dabb family protein [Acidimicrobiales bacterium]
MFRHCVMFRWNDGVDDGIKGEISAALDRMAALPMVHDYSHSSDAGVSDGNFDYAVVADFANIDDYRSYAVEPSHVEMINNLLKPNIAARSAVQYEL